jgi:formylglycine-generating enzyme required for sulfatase activity
MCSWTIESLGLTGTERSAMSLGTPQGDGIGCIRHCRARGFVKDGTMNAVAIVIGAVAVLLVAGCGESQEGVSPTAQAAFADCEGCPEMVSIPAGEFTMGSPTSEMYRGAETQHRVTIPAFALSKYEITFDQWDACVAGGGCGDYRPEDNGWGRGNNPVINVSWSDAKAYAEWLSGKTGKAYRLPSEAEWEYAARAGTSTAFAFGETVTTDQVNYDGSPNGQNRQRTTPVGSFPANGFGLHDMHGNVWEWAADCWQPQYSAKPVEQVDVCNSRVLRGGSWSSAASALRSAARGWEQQDKFKNSIGFRVARSKP